MTLSSYSLCTSALCSRCTPCINLPALAAGSAACYSCYSARHLTACATIVLLLESQRSV
jgi:hypothetical protein